MASAEKNRRYSYEEYLAMEEQSEFKSEFYNGVIVPKGGGGPEIPDSLENPVRHSLISNNLSGEIRSVLKGNSNCLVFSSGTKVRIEAADASAVPDVMVICGGVENSM